MALDDGKRILLIEAEDVLAEITAFRLELLGYRVERAASSPEAFAAVERQRPDLILINMLLPGINGFDATDHFKNDQRTSDIPVLALSNNADLDQVQRAFECGAADFLVVPYNPAVLEEKIQRLLEPAAG
jgi:CheY-like chemotaxis protein